ncbi:hypothetical protein [Rubritalea tangerina]|uniref:hypothetical protein n=1 Tax=Rubritalea tangerina TaxID=430798 RepID=UPI003623D5D8
MNDKLSRVNAEFQDDGTPKNSATESIQHSKTSTQHSCATHALVPKLRFDEFNAVYSSYHWATRLHTKEEPPLKALLKKMELISSFQLVATLKTVSSLITNREYR